MWGLVFFGWREWNRTTDPYRVNAREASKPGSTTLNHQD